MPNIFGVYYDWGQHIRLAGITKEYFTTKENYYNDKFIRTMDWYFRDDNAWYEEANLEDELEDIWENHSTPLGGYCGIVAPNEDSNTVRFSSVVKEDKPICFM